MYLVSVVVNVAGVQLLNVVVVTEVPDNAGRVSNVVGVLTAPVVMETVPVQVPEIVKIFDHPAEVNAA